MNTTESREISVTEVMNTRHKQSAEYIMLERAIPSLADGMKTTQRKIVHIATKRLNGGKEMQIAAFSGYVLAEAKYHHGDSALQGGIATMAQRFKQSIPYLDSDSQIGTIYSPEAGAARYVSVTLSTAFELLMKDNDLLEYKVTEGVVIEPKHYLPIVPTAMFNTIQGIGVGHSSNVSNKNPLAVINATLEYLKKGKLPENLSLVPYFHGAIGKWIRFNDRFEHHGFMEVVNTTTVRITGLPATTTFEDFEWNLNRLVNIDYAKSWRNLGTGGAVDYEVKFSRDALKAHIDHDTLYHELKMYGKIQLDNLTYIDFDRTVRRFPNEASVITAFVDWRLMFFQKRKDKLLLDWQNKIDFNNHKIRFIKLNHSGDIQPKMMLSKADATQILDKFELPHELLDVKYYTLTMDELKRLENQCAKLQQQINDLRTKTAKDLYIQDVTVLRDLLVKDGYVVEPCEYINNVIE